MDQVISRVLGNLDYFVLAFIRVSALIISSPIFGRRNIPNVVKIGLCLFITYIVFIANTQPAPFAISGIPQFALLCIKELLFGLVLGYVTTLLFSVVQTAGYVIDMQMGFGMVNVFDVQSNINVPVSGNFLYIILSLCFFVVNGHHQLIYILISTFQTIPIGQVSLNPSLGLTALEVFIMAFLLAINVAMPIIASGLLGEAIMGFVVRTTPQMNIFVVGMPLKIILGFMVLIFILPTYVSFTEVIFQKMFEAIDLMLKGLSNAV